MQNLSVILACLFFSSYVHAQVVAKIGNREITLSQFNERYSQVKRDNINPPSPEVFLDDLVRYEVGIQEAEKKKLQDDPVVKEKMRQELYKSFVEKELGKKVDGIQVTEAEMREFYKKNPEIRSSHILIEFKPGATPEQIEASKKRAQEIYSEVKKSKRSFEELVKLYSDDSLSKATGGDIGYQNRITVVPSYYDALLNTKVGEISGPLRTIYGFHIVKVTGRRSFQDATRWQIRAAVFDEKRKVIFDQYFKKLITQYSVTKNEKLINSPK